MPRLYTLPDAKECKLQDPRHCQHAEGMRLAGYGDPVVFQNDRLEIRAIANGHRLVFSPNAQQFVSAKQFDAGQPEAAGTVFDLGHPISITPHQEANRHQPQEAARCWHEQGKGRHRFQPQAWTARRPSRSLSPQGGQGRQGKGLTKARRLDFLARNRQQKGPAQCSTRKPFATSTVNEPQPKRVAASIPSTKKQNGKATLAVSSRSTKLRPKPSGAESPSKTANSTATPRQPNSRELGTSSRKQPPSPAALLSLNSV